MHPMSTQPNEHEAVSDNELEAAAGGVSADGQELGKKVNIGGGPQNLNIAQVNGEADSVINLG